MKKFIVLSLAVYFIFFFSCSKDSDDSSGVKERQVKIDGDFLENHGFHSICRTHDNKFALVARKGQAQQLYVTLLDSSLKMVWEKVYGSGIDNAGGIIESSDGGFIIATNKKVENSGHPVNYCLYLVKLTSAGNLLWDRTYWFESSYWEDYPIIETADKGFMISVGYHLPEDTSRYYPTLFKVGQNGDSLWIKGIPDLFNCIGFDLGMAADGDFLVASMCAISRTDSSGDLLWSRSPGYLPWSLDVLPDGSVASLGTALADSGSVIVLSRTDINGNEIWKKYLDQGYDIELYNLYQTTSGFVFLCKKNSVLKLVKTDNLGNKLSEQVLEGFESTGFVPAGDLFCTYTMSLQNQGTSVGLIISLVY